MPLIHGKSKKTLQKNIETEMHAHPGNRDQNLAIAYSVQRKAKKKKASGGTVESGSRDMNMAEGGSISAKSEKRPMPNDLHNDSMQAHENSGKKPPHNDSWTDRPDIAQSQNKPKTQPIKHPRMVPSDAFSTRLYDQEGNLMGHFRPASPDEQPDKEMDEHGANRQGPALHDMESEHSTHRKPYAKGGKVDYEKRHQEAQSRFPSEHEKGVHAEAWSKPKRGQSEAGSVMRQVSGVGGGFEERGMSAVKAEHKKRLSELQGMPKAKFASGGMVDEEDYSHPENMYEDSHLPGLTPSHDEGDMYAEEHDEEDADGHGPDVPALHMKMMAEGGNIRSGKQRHNMEKGVHAESHTREEASSEAGDTYVNRAKASPMLSKRATDAAMDEHRRRLSELQSMPKPKFAEGGKISPHDEEEMEHEDSIAAACMAKRAKASKHEAAMSDSDIDEMVRLYEGGEVDLHSEHEEEPNNEDQMSFQALKKENYNSSDLDIDQPEDSNERSPEHEKMDDHDEDMIHEIMSRRKKKQFKDR